MEFRRIVSGLLAVLSFSAGGAFASEPGLRLIETAPGQRQWMNESEILNLSKAVHARGRCGGFFDVTDFQDEVATPVVSLGGFETRVANQQATIDPLMPEVSAVKLNDTVKALSAFKNRYYKSQFGVNSAQWIKSQFLTMAQGRNDITVEEVAHTFIQPSIIARIAGTGTLAAQKVILGAHQDSINQGGGSPTTMVAPGADDDASGIATVLEAFRIITESGYRPKRTLEFMAYAGEEVGLLGSQDIAKKYKAAGASVFAMIQFDMTMYPGRVSSMTLMKDYVDKGLTQYLGLLIDTYVKAPWGTDECGYGCSDHASWNRAGYASAIPFETLMDEYNPAIHSSGDTLARLNTAFGAQFAKLAVAVAIELSATQ